MPSPRINNRRDVMLLLLYSPGETEEPNEPIVGRTRLVKMLFLFKKEALRHFKRGTDINEDNFYDFFAWDFGPFSAQVYDDLMFFILRGFIHTSQSDEQALPESADEWEYWLNESGQYDEASAANVFEEEEFSLTRKGCRFTEELYAMLSSEQQELLKQFKNRMNKAGLRAILRYVYSQYEEMTGKSKIREKIRGNS